jgi:hypothetical protein
MAFGVGALASGLRQGAGGDAMVLLFIGLLGVFFIWVGVKLFADGEEACVLDRRSGTMQGIGSFRRKIVCRLDEITTNVEKHEMRTGYIMSTAYLVRLHPNVVVGGFSTPEEAEALAAHVRAWLKKGPDDSPGRATDSAGGL